MFLYGVYSERHCDKGDLYEEYIVSQRLNLFWKVFVD